MQRTALVLRPNRRLGSIAITVVLMLLFTGCGPIGDKKSEPTSTTEVIAQPTVGVDQSTASTNQTIAETGTATSEATATTSDQSLPGNADSTAKSTPEPTPEPTSGVLPTGSVSTPAGTALPTATVIEPQGGLAGTPTNESSAATAVAPIAATTVPGTASGASFSGSDGTSGATPDTNATVAVATGVSSSPVASPGAFFVREETTPDVSKAPEKGNLTSVKPLSVNSCKPGTVIPMPGAPVTYVTLYELNFRAGPGADCAKANEVPISGNTEVQVMSWPVTREGDSENVWIQVKVDNQTGWVVIDGLEPKAP